MEIKDMRERERERKREDYVFGLRIRITNFCSYFFWPPTQGSYFLKMLRGTETKHKINKKSKISFSVQEWN